MPATLSSTSDYKSTSFAGGLVVSELTELCGIIRDASSPGMPSTTMLQSVEKPFITDKKASFPSGGSGRVC